MKNLRIVHFAPLGAHEVRFIAPFEGEPLPVLEDLFEALEVPLGLRLGPDALEPLTAMKCADSEGRLIRAISAPEALGPMTVLLENTYCTEELFAEFKQGSRDAVWIWEAISSDPPAGSYVRVCLVDRATIGVFTYTRNCEAAQTLALSGKWFGPVADYDEALYRACLLSEGGYELRDELADPMTRKSLEARQ